MRIPITHEEALGIFAYNPDTGSITWRAKRGRALVGCEAGTITRHGYRRVILGRRGCMAHRLAWFISTGEWPPDDKDIDHRNGNRLDNRLANLRIATRGDNMHNMRRRGGTSRFKGVHWDGRRKKWIAQLMVEYRHFYLGRFETEEEAHAAYCVAAAEHHGDFARVA